MTEQSPGPFTVAALRRAFLEGHEPPPVPAIARLKSYRWFVVGTVCIGAFMAFWIVNGWYGMGLTRL